MVKKKQIPIKNYLILGAIIIVTLIFSIYLFAWFKQYNETKISTPIITKALREVDYNNLSTVVKERDVLIVYMCTTSEDICRNFEKRFVSYIKSHNLTEEIIYLNLGYSKDENNSLDKVYNKYKSDTLVKKMYDYPTLVIFNQGKIVDILSSNKDSELTIEKVEDFLKDYEI